MRNQGRSGPLALVEDDRSQPAEARFTGPQPRRRPARDLSSARAQVEIDPPRSGMSILESLKSWFKKPVPDRQPGTEGGSLQGQATRDEADEPNAPTRPGERQ